MAYKLGEISLDRLRHVHPDLVRVVKRAIEITDVDFTVLEGLRTLDRQKQLVASGASTTMNSRHLTGHAVDLAPVVDGKVSWDWPLYHRIAKAVKQAAKELGVPVEWGGDWKSFKDGPHWQLPWKRYPADSPVVGKKYTGETDKAAKTKALAALGTAATAAPTLAIEPVTKAVDTLTSQQNELTSGDVTRICVALVIIALTVWFAWRKL